MLMLEPLLPKFVYIFEATFLKKNSVEPQLVSFNIHAKVVHKKYNVSIQLSKILVVRKIQS